MPVFIRIPTPLRGLTNGQKAVEVEGKTVSDVLLDLDAKYPGIREKLYDKETLLSIPGRDGTYLTANPRHEPGDPTHPGVDRKHGH